MPQQYHFIAIGGAVMHNLALELAASGHQVSGSDDEIYEPSRSRLARAGLLPAKMGWHPQRVHTDLKAVILGMHARPDNPELQRAVELGIPVLSFPEFVAARSAGKRRVVVAGSHGKTTTTSMIMHVLKEAGRDFDYLVGAQLEGFDLMVRLREAEVIVIEGDEYLSSPVDRRPKFLHYDPDVLVLTGIAWDHMNVFPTFEIYVQQFADLLHSLRDGVHVIYDDSDEHLVRLITELGQRLNCNPYGALSAIRSGENLVLEYNAVQYPISVFGQHNLKNLHAALHVVRLLGLSEIDFYGAMTSFQGAAKRLDCLYTGPEFVVYKDFAHAPSKVRATVDAVRENHPDRPLIACLELHTYSSLNKDFLPQYRGTLAAADSGIVFFSPHTLTMKKLPPLQPAEIRHEFAMPSLFVVQSRSSLLEKLHSLTLNQTVILFMSSGTFDGLDIPAFIASVEDTRTT